MSGEARIILDGQALTLGESGLLFAALEAFAESLRHRDALGRDAYGRSRREACLDCLDTIRAAISGANKPAP